MREQSRQKRKCCNQEMDANLKRGKKDKTCDGDEEDAGETGGEEGE